MPLIVRSPVIVYLSPSAAKPVDSNDISGYWATSKKSLVLMNASRSELPLSTESVLTTALTLESSGFSPMVTSAEKSLNAPCTLAIIMWRATKPT